MEQSLVDAGTCRKRLILTFSPDDVAEALDESYREIDNYVQIKGFRKGKAPRRLLEKKFAREAASGAAEHLSEKNLEKALRDSKLKIMGAIEKKRGDGVVAAGRSYVLEVEFDVRPEFDLPEYRALDLTREEIKVEDAQVDERLEHFRTMFAHYHEVDGPAEKGDILNVDFKAEVDGKEFMNMEDKNLRVDGEQLFGLPYPELVEKFSGAKAGDAFGIELPLPDDHPDPELKSKTARIGISVKKVERPDLPELDDAFAGNIGMGSLADFRQRIHGSLARDAILAARARQEQEVIDKLVDATSFPIPEETRLMAEKAFLEQRKNEFISQGLQGEGFEKAMEEVRGEAAKRSERQIRWEIIASAIADKEEFKVSNEELAEHVGALAQSYRTTSAKIIQRVREIDGVGPMMREILDIKVMQLILDAAKGAVNIGEDASADTGKANARAADSVNGGEEPAAAE
ncbi:MAG: trigger factor [Planctomycetota bacterium]|jgi:trigger factor|nr:trigger factor [Planctomycetota bacterium]